MSNSFHHPYGYIPSGTVHCTVYSVQYMLSHVIFVIFTTFSPSMLFVCWELYTLLYTWLLIRVNNHGGRKGCQPVSCYLSVTHKIGKLGGKNGAVAEPDPELSRGQNLFWLEPELNFWVDSRSYYLTYKFDAEKFFFFKQNIFGLREGSRDRIYGPVFTCFSDPFSF